MSLDRQLGRLEGKLEAMQENNEALWREVIGLHSKIESLKQFVHDQLNGRGNQVSLDEHLLKETEKKLLAEQRVEAMDAAKAFVHGTATVGFPKMGIVPPPSPRNEHLGDTSKYDAAKNNLDITTEYEANEMVVADIGALGGLGEGSEQDIYDKMLADEGAKDAS